MTGLDHVIGIAYSPTSGLVGLTSTAAFSHPASLFRIDVLTGASQLIGSTGLTAVTEGDLSFDGTSGTLYGLYRLVNGQRQLFTINVATGTATAFGSSLPGDPSAMAFDAGGTLFVLDTSLSRIMRVDKNTGSVLSSVALSAPLGSTAGMAIDWATGIAYVADGEDGATSKLYRLNLGTGQLTELGPTGLARGIAGLTVVPEPGAIGLLVAAGLFVLRRRCF